MNAAHKLFGTYSKIKRANQHIDDLDQAIRTFKSTNPNKIASKRDPDTRRLIYYVEEMRVIPVEIPLIVGECVHSLRSALDHLAFQLWVASGSNGNPATVGFPIFDEPAKFHAGLAGKIKGLSQTGIDAITAIQPYKGGNGNDLWVIHELNKIDKHRLLLTANMGFHGMTIPNHLTLANFIGVDPAITVGMSSTLFPLKVGDELFMDIPDTKPNENLQFAVQISLNEPGIVEGESLFSKLVELSDFVKKIVAILARLL